MRETLSVREMLEDVVDPGHTALLVIDVRLWALVYLFPAGLFAFFPCGFGVHACS